MTNSLFFKKIKENKNNKSIVAKFEQYQNENPTEQIYLITSPLGENDYSYEYEDKALVVLSPKHKILFVDLADDEDFWYFLRELLLMEDGYIRFDYDPENEDGDMHPINHFDIFYSNNATFKVGLSKLFEQSQFINVIDNNKKCRYIK